MSGGHFDNQQFRLHDIAQEIKHLIAINEDSSKNKFGDTVGNFYSKETINQFIKAVKLLDEVGDLVHHIDYLICGDYSEETFHERIKRTN